MIDKTRILKAQKYAFAKDGLCLSTEYIGARDKLEWKCNNTNHPAWFNLFHSVVKLNRWCRQCYKERPIKNKTL